MDFVTDLFRRVSQQTLVDHSQVRLHSSSFPPATIVMTNPNPSHPQIPKTPTSTIHPSKAQHKALPPPIPCKVAPLDKESPPPLIGIASLAAKAIFQAASGNRATSTRLVAIIPFLKQTVSPNIRRRLLRLAQGKPSMLRFPPRPTVCH